MIKVIYKKTSFDYYKDGAFIAYCEDDGVWRALHNGYKSLLRAGFAMLLELGLNADEADDAKMLYQFMEELGKKLRSIEE